jgi:hypothetical protein
MNETYKLRFAKYSDKKKIMSFIGNYWSKNHLLSNDEKFFDFQYRLNKNLQFILAIDVNSRIVGLLGYMQYGQHKKNQDIALALWKVIPNLADPLLGIKLIVYLRENLKHKSVFCVGINKKTTGVYKFMGFQTGRLLHYAAFNKDCKKFYIGVPPLRKKIFAFSNIWLFKKSNQIDKSLDKLMIFTSYKEKIPFKSKNYIIKRYLNHPYFIYNFHEVYRDNSFLGIVISREVKHLKGKALRIIDLLADDKYISKIINEFAIILTQSLRKYEYIDVYGSNLDMKILKMGNYELISDSPKIIVPDYFSPFEKRNIDIFFFSTNDKPVCLFKGDSDQDNPRINFIKNSQCQRSQS